MRRILQSLFIATALTGCSFSRSVVNGHVRDIDTSWIEPGRTTRDEIIRRIGASPSMKEGGGITPNAFRWVMSDSFTGRLEVGYVVTPTFERGTMHFAEDILVLFDDAGVVTLLSRTRSKDGKDIELVEWKEL